ncbi:MAG: (Fe-S)-binding protein, partial [Actinobacteria bacterium]|nr:(Fe-S)-binding protein [Actinomycetota bacterium]
MLAAIVLTLVAAVIGSSAVDRLAPYAAEDPQTESVRADALLARGGVEAGVDVVALVKTPSGATSRSGRSRVERVAGLLRADADIGRVDTATTRAADLQARLEGAETVVVADPHCARWLGVDQADARVRTVTSFLAAMVATLPLSEDAAEPVAWHDPCWLGRGMAEYDEARAVVSAASGAAPLEPEHTRDRAWCAGGGMGYAEADPEGAAEILRRRAAELRA